MEATMNKDTMAGNWEQVKGEAKRKWAKFTDNDLLLLKGDRQKFLGKIQEAYGKSKDEAERELKAFEESCGCSSSDKAA
jgi:uncharacterized protein YjbJ (UPF0337 family)